MLYQVIEFTYPTTFNQYVLPPGQLGVFRIDLSVGQVINLQMNQLIADPTHAPQDQTMRCWISNQQGGNPKPVDNRHWHLTALQRRIITMYDVFSGVDTPEGIPVDVAPGAYWLNILNLVNETNSFYLEITGA